MRNELFLVLLAALATLTTLTVPLTTPFTALTALAVGITVISRDVLGDKGGARHSSGL